jgi:hypothetical protein
MRSGILNKRKEWLDKSIADSLDVWSKDADELQHFTNTLKYFGFKQCGISFEIDASNKVPYFQHSLDLFKIVTQKQIAKEDIGLPFLEKFPEYDALITIVGFSPEPLMHTILALAPKKVYPVATEESARDFYKVSLNPITKKPDGKIGYFEAIIERYKEPYQTIIVEDIRKNVASIGSMDTFKRVREIIHAVRQDDKNAKIAIDITGGKKSADVSAFLTASVERDIDIFYVDFEDHNGVKACCGTEFLNKLDNPYDIYNIESVSQAIKLFKKYNYSAANEIFKEAFRRLDDDVERKYDMSSEKQKIENMQKAAECYMYWDRYEYSEIKEEILPQIQLDLLRGDKYYKVLDYLLNAERRFNQGYYNDAILRLLQVVESLLVVNSESINQAINESVKNEKLRSGLHELRKERNAFAHKNKTIEKLIYIKGFSNVKQLICVLFKKLIGDVEADLKKYTLSTEFNADGTLKS